MKTLKRNHKRSMLTYFFLHLPLYISEHIKEKQNEHTIHSTTHVQKADESRPDRGQPKESCCSIYRTSALRKRLWWVLAEKAGEEIKTSISLKLSQKLHFF